MGLSVGGLGLQGPGIGVLAFRALVELLAEKFLRGLRASTCLLFCSLSFGVQDFRGSV